MDTITFSVWRSNSTECLMSGAASDHNEAIWAIIEFYQECPEWDSNNSGFQIDE